MSEEVTSWDTDRQDRKGHRGHREGNREATGNRNCAPECR